jgi:exonuclease SbcC
LRIRKILLENIRSHDLNEVKINNGITVFTGRTGSGKSSILMALEYALFGSDSGVSNSTILRRGKQACKVELEFEGEDGVYTIVRGLRRQGKNITVDINNMRILKNGLPLNLIGRSTDLNEKVIEILGYPGDIKPKELFEITSYTKQDEIRAIIELSAERRQDYIDKILQLAKYKQTWENLKPVIDRFGSELKEKGIKLENYDRLVSELAELEKKIVGLLGRTEKNKAELALSQERLDDLRSKTASLDKEHQELLESRRVLDQLKGKEAKLRVDIEKLQQHVSELSKKMSSAEDELSKLKDVPDLDSVQEKNIGLLKTEELLIKELSKLAKEFEDLKSLGKGRCPTCKQEVTEKHLADMDVEFKKLKQKTEQEISAIRTQEEELRPIISGARKKKLLQEQLLLLKTTLEERADALESTRLELQELDKDIPAPKDLDRLPELESYLKKLKDEETELSSKIRGLSSENAILEAEAEERKQELADRTDEVKELEKGRTEVERLERATQLLARMREDIRNIREIIRNNFLEDFRQEFQKKFEEIRKYEQEYTVDIKNDYEPVAFASGGEEAQIAGLSGGEKTSVALAYRLALAALAAQVSAIKPSEILILDEPTTGFDEEDVKALPEALRNIRTIPQIVIVTHEEELKNAADSKFEVKKHEGRSIVSYAN